MKYAIALDIGGTSIKYTLVNQNGDILYESSETTQSKENPRPLSDTIKSIVRKMTDYARSRDWGIYGIGIGVPSVVDNGVVLFANNLPELDNQQLDLALAEFNLPVFIDNDANLMGLGEVIYGAAKGLSDIVFLTVGTGIGGALFLNGRLYGGYRNRGTELGHLIIHGLNGNQCTCGASGCLEAHASVSALIALYRQLLEKNGREISSRIDGKYIVERYKAQEKEAVLAMEDHFRNLSLGVAAGDGAVIEQQDLGVRFQTEFLAPVDGHIGDHGAGRIFGQLIGFLQGVDLDDIVAVERSFDDGTGLGKTHLAGTDLGSGIIGLCGHIGIPPCNHG